jgi:hypothetical protein
MFCLTFRAHPSRIFFVLVVLLCLGSKSTSINSTRVASPENTEAQYPAVLLFYYHVDVFRLGCESLFWNKQLHITLLSACHPCPLQIHPQAANDVSNDSVLFSNASDDESDIIEMKKIKRQFLFSLLVIRHRNYCPTERWMAPRLIWTDYVAQLVHQNVTLFLQQVGEPSPNEAVC